MEKMIGDKMVIKIKIPKLSAVATDGEKTPEQDVIGILSSKTAEGKKVCMECKKEFSSGKALGGHMRVHVQSSANHKNPNFQKPPKTTKIHNNGGDAKPYYLNSVNDEGKPTCSQCGKTFPSMKSLFGHMRCHPERVWRGILPPPNTPTSAAALRRSRILNNSSASGCSTSSENDLSVSEQRGGKIDGDGGSDQVVDLTKFLRGWTVTERRGRRALKPPADDAEDDDVLLEAVEDLMSLAYGNGVGGVGSMTESVITQRQLKLEGSNSKAVTEEEIDVTPSPPANFDEYSDGRNTHKSPYKRKKIKLMMELEPEPNGVVPTPLPPVPELQECKYKCTTCNKCFASHQALGGHRSSHNKPRVTSADRLPPEEADHRSLILNLLSVVGDEGSEKEAVFAGGFNFNFNSSNGVHQCKICDKIFATGQALGGHQRCHWSGGVNVAQAQSSQITSAGEGGSQTGSDHRKVLDFDLNEIPPAGMMELEEETGSGNGNGYASSSYNSNICAS